MTIMAVYLVNAATKQNYDDIKDAIGWETDPPDGALLHFAGFDKQGACSVELWESEAQFEAYRRDRYDPACEQAGLGRLEARVLEVHNAAAAGSVETYVPILEAARLRTRAAIGEQLEHGVGGGL